MGKISAKSVQVPDELIKAQSIANITDTAVRIPIIGVKVGLDFLIGLVPVVGDLITGLMALRIVQLARRMDVPKQLQKAMLRNIVLDILLGFVPVIGDMVDIFFKANRANVKMMENWWLRSNKGALQQQTQKQLEDWETKL